jgi:hypothetical protein
MAAKDRSIIDEELKRLNAEISKFKRDVVLPPKESKRVDVVSTLRLEKAIEKEVTEVEASLKPSSKSGPLAFYFLSSLVCVAVLAYLFGSMATFVFYSVFCLALWWWARQFHTKSHGLLKSLFALGSVVVFLYFAYWLFTDLMSILLCVLYALSFFISGLLFFYHTRRELSEEIHRSFGRTFLVVFYSHVIAFTAASALAYLLPMFLLSDSFVSMAFLMVAWLFPCLLLYFFLDKFLYLRFFDRKHIKRDFLKGIGHGVAYSVIFIVLVALAYVLTAMQFAMTERSSYDSAFTEVFTGLQNVKYEIDTAALNGDTPELMGLQVSRDVIRMSDVVFTEAASLKSVLAKSGISIEDYFSDNYFTRLSRDRLAVNRVRLNATEVGELKSDLLREYARLKSQEAQGAFDDGTTTLDDHYAALVEKVTTTRVPYSEPYDVVQLRKMMSDPNSYSGLMGDGALLDFVVANDPDFSIFVGGKSRFGRLSYDLLYHTVLFRDLMLFTFETMTMNLREVFSQSAVRAIAKSDPGEALKSKVLRYRIVLSEQDALINVAKGG